MITRLFLKETHARRVFKGALGQNNHFLITIMIGLDAVERGDAHLSQDFSTVWEPRDVQRSAQRSRQFVCKALMAWLVDAIDGYISNLMSSPAIITNASLITALRRERSIGGRVRRLASNCGEQSAIETLLVRVAIIWRNRLVHYKADNMPGPALSNELRHQAEAIASDYQGLDIERLLLSLERTRSPTFKEITALVRSAHKWVQRIDSSLLTRIDLDDFIRSVLASYVQEDPGRRINNVWGKDIRSRLSTLIQIAQNYGMTIDGTEFTNHVSDDVIQEMIQWTPARARAELAPNG